MGERMDVLFRGVNLIETGGMVRGESLSAHLAQLMLERVVSTLWQFPKDYFKLSRHLCNYYRST